MTDDQYGREGDEDQPWEAGDEYDPAEDAGEEQLALDAGEEQLPWLESDEDYDDEDVDTARIIGFALLGLLVIALLVGGIWWVSRDKGGAIEADGSTIAAPAGEIKTRPDDPGGKTFEGTGDTSFAVGEGQTREGVIADTPTPQPSITAATVDSAQQAAATTPASGGVGVQVGAYSTRARAEQGWSTLVRQHSVLSGVSHRIIEGEADIGRVFRLQAVASDKAAADAMCGSIRAGGGSCQVKP